MTTHAIPQPRLSATLVRRRPPSPRPATPVARTSPSEPMEGWSDELRFFLTCYAAGVVFFLVMLS